MWIVRLALRRPYTFVVMSMLIVLLGVRRHHPHAHRHLPRNRHPRRQRHLDLQRHLSRGDVGSHHHPQRARHHHHGQRHRAHGIAVASRPRHHQALLPSQRPRSRRPSPSSPPARSLSLRTLPTGIDPALHPPLQRLHRPHPAARPFQRQPERAGHLRSRLQLHPHPDGHRAGRQLPAALRRHARARSPSISIPRRSTPRASRPWTSSTPSTPRT